MVDPSHMQLARSGSASIGFLGRDNRPVAIVLNLLAAGMLIWLAVRRTPLWISVLVICLFTSPWLFGWLHEVDELDTQPGLLLFGGVVSVAFLVLVAGIARLV